jgi:FkbM family methyltransferase
MDGVSYDTMAGYISTYELNGLYVEPNPEQFVKLSRKFSGKAKLDNCAISTTNDGIEMMYIPESSVKEGELMHCLLGMSTEYPPRNGFTGEKDKALLEKYGVKYRAKSKTLEKLFSDNDIKDFGILQIDVEGYEWEIVKQFDFNKYHPELLNIEICSVPSEENTRMRNYIKSAGYVIYDNGQDIVCLTEEFDKIIKAEVTVSEPVRPMTNNITLVTALFDLKRGEMDTGFKRPFSQYLEHFGRLLKACKDTPMIVFVDPAHENFVRVAREGSAGTDIRTKKAEDFRTWFAFYKEVQEIRKKPEWLGQAGWLAESTQAKLELYNPLVMSKMFLLHDCTCFNPFDTDYFCWIDAGLTQTVHPGYFSHDKVIQKMMPLLNKFLFVCYPYVGAQEIHGFDRKEMHRLAGVDYVDRVARGGFFGGHKNHIKEMNNAYYHLLQDTITRGYMGTEESIFTLLTYIKKEIVQKEMIDDNGLISTFFERVKNMPIPKNEISISKSNIPEDVEYFQSEEEVAMNKSGNGTNLYITCFNIPDQLMLLIDSMEKYNPELLKNTNKYLIDNSTDESVMPRFDEIANKYGFELIRKGNLGVCGARQWAAQHFHDSNAKYIVWFEDDMLMQDKNILCKNGLNMHCDNWLGKCINIVQEEKLDFIKISFSEFFGDHHKQWAWHNVPQSVKNKYFPDGTHRMRWKESGCIDGLSYLIGDVYYSNWPSVMTKAGNYKIFLETVYASPFEQTIMSHAFQTMKKGRLRSAVLMASLVNHNRVFHYSKEIRKEC